ncbi:S8 family peptidase [Pseudarthrobacter oxydans]|uniref:S8 family peptidase n=1 Tax=Pseudarthrobacter oxydans TaxID=1671 RepID=UPI003ECD582D
MSDNVNFILGYGERLSEPVPPPGKKMDAKKFPYTPEEAIIRLLPQIHGVNRELSDLPNDVFPDDEAVAAITLHPQFLAKSYFPETLLNGALLRAIGSTRELVVPEKWTKKGNPELSPTTKLFVAGARSSFERWAGMIESSDLDDTNFKQLSSLERIGLESPQTKVKLNGHDEKEVDAQETLHLEVVLHGGTDKGSGAILRGFANWADHLQAEPSLDRRLTAGGLTFIPVRIRKENVRDLAKFSFLRIARSMPRLRTVRPTYVTRISASPTLQLPSSKVLDPDVRVAVFDGGLDPAGPLQPWSQSLDAGDVGASSDEGLDHGHAVTSAVLFGSLDGQTEAPQPFGSVDHYRVYDENSENDPDELYNVIDRITAILATRPYEFVVLSIGPELPIDDKDIHAWTSKLDEFLSSGETLLVVAAGNGGELDRTAGNSRIMPPADCVNALSVGAADSDDDGWSRASYSSHGPGRSPGIVKPDVLAFGGSTLKPFRVLHPDRPGRLLDTLGTSFAGPTAMRLAMGARATLGNRLTPLALKALLVHASEAGSETKEDSGWGKVPTFLDELIICPDGTTRVVYQGKLDGSRFLRTPIPLPPRELSGMVTVTATFAIAVPVDPAFAETYTQAGLDIVFRPHAARFDDGSQNAKSDSYFRLSDFSDEADLRKDAHKWETVLHRSRRFRGSSLLNPVFDVHCLTREGGGSLKSSAQIPYAAVISVHAPSEKDLYNEILRTYPAQLQAMQPVVQVPIRV